MSGRSTRVAGKQGGLWRAGAMLGCMLARSETDKLLAVYNGERTVI